MHYKGPSGPRTDSLSADKDRHGREMYEATTRIRMHLASYSLSLQTRVELPTTTAAAHDELLALNSQISMSLENKFQENQKLIVENQILKVKLAECKRQNPN